MLYRIAFIGKEKKEELFYYIAGTTKITHKNFIANYSHYTKCYMLNQMLHYLILYSFVLTYQLIQQRLEISLRKERKRVHEKKRNSARQTKRG